MDLEQLYYQEFEKLIVEEIPSDGESEDGLYVSSDVELEDIPEPIVELHTYHSDSDFSESDLIPLSELQRSEVQKLDEFQWTQNQRRFEAPNAFQQHSGHRNIDENVELPIEVFSCLFPENIIFENFVYQINLYATQTATATGKSFTATNLDEIKIFFAINLMTGINPLPSYRDYWSSRVELRNNYISGLMPRARFDWLLGNFHGNDNMSQPKRGEPQFDKLYKIRPFLETLNHSFKKYYAPSENISIDESIILFKGRSSLKQYIPNKPIKRGYKVWLRASASGYVDDFQIYTGKVGGLPEKNLGPRVIKDLTNSLSGKNHRVYFDNYFTSLPLLRELKQNGIYACGTVRKGRRGTPNDLRPDKSLARGEYDWRVTKDGISFTKWIIK